MMMMIMMMMLPAMKDSQVILDEVGEEVDSRSNDDMMMIMLMY